MIVFWICQFLFLINVLYFVIHGFIVRHYKPFIYNSDEQWPTCTILVPAFNEGKHVLKTLKSLKNIDYPSNKYQIIVIDDGSTDNTLFWIKQAQKLNNKIEFIKINSNKGKRNALYTGIQQSTGDIIITIDSDSTIKPDTIKNLIIPFIKDQRIGAVAGNVLIENRYFFIPKMLSSAFVFGFEFIRSAQSVMGIVMCTPGALSAYRKSVFNEKDLFKWLKQIFLFHRASIGEDRALTNIVLKNNYRVVYQSNAIGYTTVPINYITMCKMFIRWIRGDIRENIYTSFWIFKRMFKNKNYCMIGLLFNYIMMFVWLASPIFLLGYLGIIIILGYKWFIISTIILTILWSSLTAFVYFFKCNKLHDVRHSLIYTYLFGLINAFTLFWLVPYCWITIDRSGWLTR